jgi:hypothetical protein
MVRTTPSFSWHPNSAPTDDYYLLKQGASSSAPTRVDKAAFTPELDLLSDIIKPTYSRSVGELASSASGLKVSFDSNRTYTLICQSTENCALTPDIPSEHGLMVYTNGLSSASKGARKHAHGGSGISNHGDSYGPGGTTLPTSRSFRVLKAQLPRPQTPCSLSSIMYGGFLAPLQKHQLTLFLAPARVLGPQEQGW